MLLYAKRKWVFSSYLSESHLSEKLESLGALGMATAAPTAASEAAAAADSELLLKLLEAVV